MCIFDANVCVAQALRSDPPLFLLVISLRGARMPWGLMALQTALHVCALLSGNDSPRGCREGLTVSRAVVLPSRQT
jgi:hypothetical protein